MSRTYKQPYTKSKVFDKTCRCNGACPYCKSNRTYKNKKREDKINCGMVEIGYLVGLISPSSGFKSQSRNIIL